MKKLIVIASFLFASNLSAILPPLAQSIRELQTILSDPRTMQLLGSSALFENIEKIDGGYIIITRDHTLQIDVEYLNTHLIGPASFKLHFCPREIRDSDSVN